MRRADCFAEARDRSVPIGANRHGSIAVTRGLSMQARVDRVVQIIQQFLGIL